MFESYTARVDFSEKARSGVRRVHFIMPHVPSLIKRRAYAIYKMPNCAEIMVSLEEDFFRMIDAIDHDIAELQKKIAGAKKKEDVSGLIRARMHLVNQKNILYANKFEFVYRGVGYDTPVCVPSIFLEEIGVTAQDKVLCIAYNPSTGEIILHSQSDAWKYDYNDEPDRYQERRTKFTFSKKSAG